MKMTLLEMTQSVLNALESDNVNSITDTIESQQVAQLIKDTYYEFISNMGIPEHDKLMQLESVSSSTRPNYLKLPADTAEVRDIRYNTMTSTDTDPRWVDVEYKDPTAFVKLVQGRRPSDVNVIEVPDFNSVNLYIINDASPKYWTTFDDEYVVFDSYDSAVESTVQGNKSSCIASVTPSWTEEDDFTPDLDHNFFPMLLAECKSMAFAIYKQAPNAKVEQKARQQKIALQNDKYRFKNDPSASLPNYGRR